ncbi:hypothetical protein [Burkholderia territorii]|uniref:hypothetical protein n=1 Tax=Burkholderia territorii TaxID=1503055 RepID=UPI001E3DFD48|nr:hypothetical protein [Burkholderia territorii]
MAGTLAEIGVKHVAMHWSGIGDFARKASHFSGALIVLVGCLSVIEAPSLLKDYGYPVETGIAGTGVVDTLRLGASARSIGIRADMDALPIDELNTFGHKSLIPGRAISLRCGVRDA